MGLYRVIYEPDIRTAVIEAFDAEEAYKAAERAFPDASILDVKPADDDPPHPYEETIFAGKVLRNS